jgi:DNA end-binding protein Ku
MRAIWKGYLQCSLVTIPIKMFTATTKRPRQFHLFHKACGSRIKQQNVSSVCRPDNRAFMVLPGIIPRKSAR